MPSKQRTESLYWPDGQTCFLFSSTVLPENHGESVISCSKCDINVKRDRNTEIIQNLRRALFCLPRTAIMNAGRHK